MRRDAVEVEELEGSKAERDGDRLCEALVGTLEERLDAGIESDLPAEGAENERGNEVAVFRRQLRGVGGVKQVVAISLPCCDEHEDVEGREACGRDWLGFGRWLGQRCFFLF